MGGWLRVFVVLAVLWGAACFWLGANDYTKVGRRIAHESRAILESPSASGSTFSPYQLGQFERLRREDKSNLTRQLITYGAAWGIGLSIFAVAIAALQWIVSGFARPSDVSKAD